MGYAVQLYFDPDLEARLLQVRAALTRTGVTPTLERLGDRPHVSLAVLEELPVPRCVAMLEQFARTHMAFRASFAAFGAFPTSQGVVYLSPTSNDGLFDAHRSMHRLLTELGAAIDKHYIPETWIPHSTIGFELSTKEVAVALSWLHNNFRPVEGMFASIGVIEFPPVKQLAVFNLHPVT
ncbi:MAG: 2'-5' RNA ligase family protein [Betaproteobacteria bacterium]|nr:MAG: 2'-5' RNA ligase family protein [Betaproteobacteria bacterium]